jgi:hypothetical protein
MASLREAAFENSDRHLITQALDQFYGTQPDDRTLKLLGRVTWDSAQDDPRRGREPDKQPCFENPGLFGTAFAVALTLTM